MDVIQRSGGATLKEVAEAAGVSVAAVSKVLHGRGKTVRVSEATAQAVRAAADSLLYHPNVLAQSLRMNRTHTVGLIWEHMQRIADGPLYYVHLLDGVSSELFENHYRLTILPEIPKVTPVRALNDGRLDGVIWCKMPGSAELRDELRRTGLKVVSLNAPPPSDPDAYPYVACDNEGGAELVVDHLANLGHRHILFVRDVGSEDTPDANAREAGFCEALRRRGLPFDESSVLTWDLERPPLAEWWASGAPHTAIFAWHEAMAGSLLIAARNAGIMVPRDLSVVGFDSTMYCDSTNPRLTAVRQPIKEMAQAAARKLLSLVEGRGPDLSSSLFPCTLDVRESTAHPASPEALRTRRRGSPL